MEIEIFGWTPLDYLQTIVDGVLFGATYAIIGIGFTLIFGVMDKLNLAYAATALAGAYLSWGVGTQIPLPAPAAYAVAAVSAGVFGYLVYLCNFRYIPPGRPSPPSSRRSGCCSSSRRSSSTRRRGCPSPIPRSSTTS